jgi:hypothetical protein
MNAAGADIVKMVELGKRAKVKDGLAPALRKGKGKNND